MSGSEREDAQRTGAAQTPARKSLVRVLSHELRNLIGTMRNAAHLIRLRNPPDPMILSAAQTVDRQIDAMVKLLDRFVEADGAARGDLAADFGPVDVQAAISNALEENRASIEHRRQAVHLAPAGMPVAARSDMRLLTQVLSRLVRNASRFAPEGGEIWIRTESSAAGVSVHVRDNGAGIPGAALPHLFEFFAGAAAPGGLGIGLPTMHATMRLLDARLEAFSEGPARGSEFVVSLPLWGGMERPADARPDSAADKVFDAPAEQSRHAATGTARRILLVDDSAAVRESFSDILADMGYEVRGAGDGEEALRSVEAWRPDYAFLDINMPLLNGYEVARRLRARFSAAELKLVMISGVTLDAVTTRDAKRAGFDYCFDKAGSFSALGEWLRQQDAG